MNDRDEFRGPESHAGQIPAGSCGLGGVAVPPEYGTDVIADLQLRYPIHVLPRETSIADESPSWLSMIHSP